MTSTELIERAENLSDLKNSDYINYNDKLSSLNESYKDLYSKITDNNDDYYVNQVVINLDSSMFTAPNEWLVPLPADFYKIRWLDGSQAQSPPQWMRIEKFPLSSKNQQSVPGYRIRGQYLWITQASDLFPIEIIRLGYYPPPVPITYPQDTVYFATEIAPDNLQYCSNNFYCEKFDVTNGTIIEQQQNMLYVYYNADTVTWELRCQSISDSQTYLLQTLTSAPTSVTYYKGYVYLIMNYDIWRAPTDLINPITLSQLSAYGDVRDFSVFDDQIYYARTSTTWRSNLDGNNAVLLLNRYTEDIGLIGHGPAATFTYLTSSGGDYYVGSKLMASGVLHGVTDRVNVYCVMSDLTLQKFVLNPDFTVAAQYQLQDEVIYMGNWWNGYLSVIDEEDQTLEAVSDQVDFDLVYPDNAAYELIAYQCAIDFMRKQGRDFTAQQARYAELWTRFRDTMMRDEYSHGRINNTRAQNAYNWWTW